MANWLRWASSSGTAEVTVTSTTFSASARRASNSEATSGMQATRPFSAMSRRKFEPCSPAPSPQTSTRSSARSRRVTAGLPIRPCTRGSDTTTAARSRNSDQFPNVSLSRAISNTALAYGLATVVFSAMAYDPSGA